MGRRYHLLLERDDEKSRWGIHFGDYSRSVVSDERRDRLDHGIKAKNLRQITVDGDTQLDCDRAVARENKLI